MIEFILNCVIIALIPFFYSGFITFIRNGALMKNAWTITSPLNTFLGLLGKGVKSGSDKNVFHEIASSVILASILMAGVMTPIVNHKSMLDFEGAFFLFLSFLLMEKIMRVLGKKNAGQKGKKSVLDEWKETLPELAVYSVLVLCSVVSGQNTFEKVFSFGAAATGLSLGMKIVVVLTLWLVLVREENGQADGYEGSDRAVVLYSGSLRSLLISSLIAGAVIPYWKLWSLEWSAFLYLLLYLVLVAVIGLSAGLAQKFLIRRKLTVYLDPALAAFSFLILCLSFLAFIF